MLHRVDVTIFDMAGTISFIANQMLPEASLPDAAFAALDPNRTHVLLFRQGLCEVHLDQPPACREIGILPRQGPDRMEMVGENHKRVDREG
jgi:hypothetical protein